MRSGLDGSVPFALKNALSAWWRGAEHPLMRSGMEGGAPFVFENAHSALWSSLGKGVPFAFENAHSTIRWRMLALRSREEWSIP